MGIFGKKKAAAAPAAAPDPLAEVSMTLSRLAHAVEALDAGVPPPARACARARETGGHASGHDVLSRKKLHSLSE